MDTRGRRAEASLAHTLHRLYGNYWQIILRSFVSGIFVGLGATIGAAIVIAAVIYLLNALSILPGVGDFFESAKEFFDQFSGR